MVKKLITFLIILFIFLILHLLGWYSFYYTIIWYDKLLHFLAGAFIIFTARQLLNRKILVSFLLLFAIAVLWEIFEFGVDRLHLFPRLQATMIDTFWDLGFAFLGGAIATIVYLLHKNVLKSK